MPTSMALLGDPLARSSHGWLCWETSLAPPAQEAFPRHPQGIPGVQVVLAPRRLLCWETPLARSPRGWLCWETCQTSWPMTLLEILSVEPTGLSMLLSLPQDGVSFGISNVPSGRSSRALYSGCSIFVQNLHEGTLVFLIQGRFSNRSPRLQQHQGFRDGASK